MSFTDGNYLYQAQVNSSLQDLPAWILSNYEVEKYYLKLD